MSEIGFLLPQVNELKAELARVTAEQNHLRDALQSVLDEHDRDYGDGLDWEAVIEVARIALAGDRSGTTQRRPQAAPPKSVSGGGVSTPGDEAAPEMYRSSAAEHLGREGILTVWDHHGRYVGCLGSETWARLIAESQESPGDEAATDVAAFRAEIQALFDAANEAKHKESDLSVVIWNSGRANAFAQVLSALDRLVAALTAAQRERDEARDAIYAPVMRAEAAEAQVESLRGDMEWLAENGEHSGAGQGPHDGCAPCFARHSLKRAALRVDPAEGES